MPFTAVKLAPPCNVNTNAAQPPPQLTFIRTCLLAIVVVLAVVVPVLVGAYTVAVVLTTELTALLDVSRTAATALLRYLSANYPMTFWNVFIGFGVFMLSVAVWCSTSLHVQVHYDIQ